MSPRNENGGCCKQCTEYCKQASNKDCVANSEARNAVNC